MKQVETFAKKFRWTPKDYYWQHTQEVRRIALRLQKVVGGDRKIIEAAALLHDIGKAELLAPGHEKISARLAKEFLLKAGFSEAKAAQVAECIRYENLSSVEERVLRSADSMSLLMGRSRGREWYFNVVLGGDKQKICGEVEKSYSEIEFGFAKEMVGKNYRRLLRRYR